MARRGGRRAVDVPQTKRWCNARALSLLSRQHGLPPIHSGALAGATVSREATNSASIPRLSAALGHDQQIHAMFGLDPDPRP